MNRENRSKNQVYLTKKKQYNDIFFFTTLFLSLLLFCPISNALTINNSIIEDFSSITGYIVKKQSQQIYIIDLDAHDGIMTGDLFSVFTEKETLTHPITEHVIGKLDKIKAILRVTQIKKGYAYTYLFKTYQQNVAIVPGDKVKRYNQIQTQFIDQTGNGKHVYTVLLKKLPHFSWKPYILIQIQSNHSHNLFQSSELNIFFHNQGLEIKDRDNRLIHFYPKQHLYEASPLDISQPMNSYPSLEISDISKQYLSLQTLGTIDGFIQSSDFIIDNDQLFMAASDNKHIYVYHIAKNHITQIASLMAPLQYQPIYLNWWRPSTVSEPHLTVTFWNNQDIESKLYVFQNKSLKILAYGINYHLASYDKNDDGNPETLMGQSMDRDTFWNSQSYRLVYFDNALRLSKRFSASRSFTVYGSILGDMTGDGLLETMWIRNGVLRIYQGQSFLYKTYVGDYPNQKITYDLDPASKISLFRNVSIYPKPLFYDVNKDNHPELFVIHSERPFLSQFGFSNQAVRTWIKCIRYHNKMFYSQRITRVFDANIQAITVYQDNLIGLMGITDRDSDQNSYTRIIKRPLHLDF